MLSPATTRVPTTVPTLLSDFTAFLRNLNVGVYPTGIGANGITYSSDIAQLAPPRPLLHMEGFDGKPSPLTRLFSANSSWSLTKDSGSKLAHDDLAQTHGWLQEILSDMVQDIGWVSNPAEEAIALSDRLFDAAIDETLGSLNYKPTDLKKLIKLAVLQSSLITTAKDDRACMLYENGCCSIPGSMPIGKKHG